MIETINFCSAIKSEATPPPQIQITRQATNWVIILNKVNNLVQLELWKCLVCKENNRELNDEYVYSLDQNIIINCETCTKIDFQYQHSINSISMMINTYMTTSTSRRKLQRKMYKQKVKIRSIANWGLVYPPQKISKVLETAQSKWRWAYLLWFCLFIWT